MTPHDINIDHLCALVVRRIGCTLDVEFEGGTEEFHSVALVWSDLHPMSPSMRGYTILHVEEPTPLETHDLDEALVELHERALAEEARADADGDPHRPGALHRSRHDRAQAFFEQARREVDTAAIAHAQAFAAAEAVREGRITRGRT